MTTTCRTCVTPIGYINCPTGGWWAHEKHPADNHDAVPAAWVDNDPLMETIAEMVWAHCRTEGTSLVVDDPRNIAATAAAVARHFAAAVPVPPPADQAALLLWAADELGRMDYDTDNTDYGYDTYRDAWNGGVMDAAALLRRVAAEEQPAETPMFGTPDCTCIPFTRQGGKPRYCGPTDTVDMISGWEIGRDCPHHKPAVGEQPETQEAHPPYSEYRVENYDAGAWQVIGLKRKTLADAQEVRDRFRRGYPDARLRIIRRDESVAVVETDPEPQP